LVEAPINKSSVKNAIPTSIILKCLMCVAHTCLYDCYASIAKGEEKIDHMCAWSPYGGITIEEQKCNMCFANDM
jgi:hypothetical protein